MTGSWTAVRLGLIALAIFWCGLWAVLARLSADPIVVNRTQIQAAALVVVGEWADPARTELRVERSLKGSSPHPVLQVADVPPESPRSGRWIVPLSPDAAGRFTVTHGTLKNSAERGGGWIEAHVRAQVYPATEDAIRQVVSLFPTEN